jgi:hypothetical protein
MRRQWCAAVHSASNPRTTRKQLGDCRNGLFLVFKIGIAVASIPTVSPGEINVMLGIKYLAQCLSFRARDA